MYNRTMAWEIDLLARMVGDEGRHSVVNFIEMSSVTISMLGPEDY